MRYLDKVVFVDESEEIYNPDFGEYIEAETKGVETLANVTDLGTTRSVQIFGDIKQGAKVVRTMPLFDIPKWKYIMFDGRKWQLVTSRLVTKSNSLIVQEVFDGKEND